MCGVQCAVQVQQAKLAIGTARQVGAAEQACKACNRQEPNRSTPKNTAHQQDVAARHISGACHVNREQHVAAADGARAITGGLDEVEL